jgi:probable HAF family extracellular repeat protein
MLSKELSLSVVGLVCAVVLSAGAATAGYGQSAASFQGLGFLSPGQDSDAYGISRNGEYVVGYSYPEAFRWHIATGMVGLGIPPETLVTVAWAVSDNGGVVVGSRSYPLQAPFHQEAIRWTDATGIVGLGCLSGMTDSFAYDVSADGSVVVGGTMNGYTYAGEAFRWERGVMTGLGCLGGDPPYSCARAASRDGLTVCGTSSTDSSGDCAAFRWAAETGMLELSAWNCIAASAAGSVIVGNEPTWYGAAAFRWTEEGTTWLGDLPGGGQYSEACDVSADGSVVVGQGESSAGREAFIWDATNGMRSIRQLLLDLGVADVQPWTLDFATAVSGDATVVAGCGHDSAGRTQAWLARLGVRRGDLTCNGLVNNFDISPFVALLAGGG